MSSNPYAKSKKIVSRDEEMPKRRIPASFFRDSSGQLGSRRNGKNEKGAPKQRPKSVLDKIEESELREALKLSEQQSKKKDDLAIAIELSKQAAGEEEADLAKAIELSKQAAEKEDADSARALEESQKRPRDSPPPKRKRRPGVYDSTQFGGGGPGGRTPAAPTFLS